jgi:AcrR family transcriptional regulator
VDVAIDVAAEHGYPNTSLAKIAVRADPLDHAIRR